MNRLNSWIYFIDETDFIILSKLYINICIYKFLWKIVQKIYFIYIYILTGNSKNIQLPIHVRMNEYAHIWTTSTDFCSVLRGTIG